MVFGDIRGQVPPHHVPQKLHVTSLSPDIRHRHKTKRHHHLPTRHRTRHLPWTTILFECVHGHPCQPTDGGSPITSHRFATNFVIRHYLPYSDPPNCGGISPHRLLVLPIGTSPHRLIVLPIVCWVLIQILLHYHTVPLTY